MTRARRDADAAAETFLCCQNRLGAIFSRRPRVKRALLHAQAARHTLIGQMLGNVRRLCHAVVVVILLQVPQEPAAALAARAELVDLAILVAKRQMNEAGFMRDLERFKSFANRD